MFGSSFGSEKPEMLLLKEGFHIDPSFTMLSEVDQSFIAQSRSK